MIKTSIRSMTMLAKTTLFFAAFSLVLVGGIYSHNPETSHTHKSIESGSSSDHAHMETNTNLDTSNQAIHCGADILQYARYDTAECERNPSRVLSLIYQMSDSLWRGLDPPPPRQYS